MFPKRNLWLKRLQHNSRTNALSKNIIFIRKWWFLQKKKKAGISKIKKALVLKTIFPETKYVDVLTYKISNF